MIPLPIGQMEWITWMYGTICLIPVIYWIVAILLCVWVYRDAESRGMNGALWLIIVLITGILGFIIYVVVRGGEKGRPPPVTRVCTNCGRTVPPEVKFCPYCGKELP